MSSAWLLAFEKKHLWMYLQALGFEPGPATAACGKIESHTHLGVDMFDKLNRDAFQIVSYFLFQTLDQSLTKEVFKHCWPPFDQKRDAEFRKHCCEWLKNISAECGSSFPPVAGSLFISPGGSKFIHLMYHFARFVAMKYIRSNSKDPSTHFIEILNVKTQDLHMCIARCQVARNRFLHILQKEDCVTRKYQENAQLSVKHIRSLRTECVAQQNQIKNMEPFDEQINMQENIEKVRSLWASVTETLEILDKEREIVSSVLSLVNHYVLDGTNVTINIPNLLIDKIEKQMSQLHIGNVYESGKLNFLTVIQLLNEVLKIMKHECCQTDQARLKIDPHFLEKETKFQRERLSDLKQTRHKMKEGLTTIRHSIVEKQGEWHKKWKEILGLSPFSLIKGSTPVSRGFTPAVDLLPPMSPLSFDPASEEVYARSILTQYPALLPDTPMQQNQEKACTITNRILGTVCDLADSSASLLQPNLADRKSITLLEKDMKISTPREKHETISKKTPEFEEEDSVSSNTAKTIESSAFGGSVPAKKRDPFQKEQDHLVEEVARAVLSDSPQSAEGKEIKLEDLIDSLVSNPFLSRKEIPRTPENLISEIRSSWRKAVEMGNNGNTELFQEDTEQHGEVLSESSPELHNPREFSLACFLSTTTESNTSQSHFLEENIVSDCLKSVTSDISQSATPDASDLLTKKKMGKQDLKCTVSQKKLSETSQSQSFSPAIGSRIDLTGSSEEAYVKILDCSQAYQEPSTHKSMLWNSFQIPWGVSSGLRDTDFGILHETLPEEVGHLSLNSSSTTEASFKLDPNSPMPSNVFPEDASGERQTTPEFDSRFQAICSRYEVLKKSLSKKRKETDLSNLETFERHKLELSSTPPNTQTGEKLDILDSKDLHIACTKPLRMSLGERKRSLSPLIKFSPVEQRWSSTIPCSPRELSNLEEDIQNKSLDADNPHRT